MTDPGSGRVRPGLYFSDDDPHQFLIIVNTTAEALLHYYIHFSFFAVLFGTVSAVGVFHEWEDKNVNLYAVLTLAFGGISLTMAFLYWAYTMSVIQMWNSGRAEDREYLMRRMVWDPRVEWAKSGRGE